MKLMAKIEVAFNITYLIAVTLIGAVLMVGASGSSVHALAGVMAWTLVVGDTFHLVPRIAQSLNRLEERRAHWPGRGKQVASVTMTVFYVFLWHIGAQLFSPPHMMAWTALIYVLAATRIFLSLLPQNQWLSKDPPLRWGLWRNIPFVIQGMAVAVLFFVYRDMFEAVGLVWLWIILSFAFYIPVVIGAKKYPAIGALMLPKSVAYIGLLAMFIFL